MASFYQTAVSPAIGLSTTARFGCRKIAISQATGLS
jgi:hypothetical protein